MTAFGILILQGLLILAYENMTNKVKEHRDSKQVNLQVNLQVNQQEIQQENQQEIQQEIQQENQQENQQPSTISPLQIHTELANEAKTYWFWKRKKQQSSTVSDVQIGMKVIN
jgi:hypothetical protein